MPLRATLRGHRWEYSIYHLSNHKPVVTNVELFLSPKTGTGRASALRLFGDRPMSCLQLPVPQQNVLEAPEQHQELGAPVSPGTNAMPQVHREQPQEALAQPPAPQHTVTCAYVPSARQHRRHGWGCGGRQTVAAGPTGARRAGTPRADRHASATHSPTRACPPDPLAWDRSAAGACVRPGELQAPATPMGFGREGCGGSMAKR